VIDDIIAVLEPAGVLRPGRLAPRQS
jgi:hypothetical protein